MYEYGYGTETNTYGVFEAQVVQVPCKCFAKVISMFAWFQMWFVKQSINKQKVQQCGLMVVLAIWSEWFCRPVWRADATVALWLKLRISHLQIPVQKFKTVCMTNFAFYFPFFNLIFSPTYFFRKSRFIISFHQHNFFSASTLFLQKFNYFELESNAMKSQFQCSTFNSYLTD